MPSLVRRDMCIWAWKDNLRCGVPLDMTNFDYGLSSYSQFMFSDSASLRVWVVIRAGHGVAAIPAGLDEFRNENVWHEPALYNVIDSCLQLFLAPVVKCVCRGSFVCGFDVPWS